MKRTLALLVTALFLTASVATGIAATLKCTVTSVDANTVVLDCGDKADKLNAGDEVKVKTQKKTAAIEGC